MKADTFFNAFILNSIATALIAGSAVEISLALENKESSLYKITNYLLAGEEVSEQQKFFSKFIITFAVALLIFNLMYLIVGFGGGMMICERKTL